MLNDYLFVYGTLMQGNHPMHKVLKENSTFVANGWMLGQLYQIRDYPGVVISSHPDDKVYGEIYQLTDLNVLNKLDDYEECSSAFAEPHEYRRERINVFVTRTKTINAWVYIYNHSVDRTQRIASGRYPMT